MFSIAMDSHKRYSQVCVQLDGKVLLEHRIEHRPGAIAEWLGQFPAGTAVALETVGNWYWIVSEIEQAGMSPQLVHAHKAKLMLGCVNKTDKLDARGLARLQQNRTVPTVWIPPGAVRDRRELPRVRMVVARQRTRLKNRIHAMFDKYGLQTEFEGISDIFGRKGRQRMEPVLGQLPPHGRYATELLLGQLQQIEQDLKRIEDRMKEIFHPDETVRRLMTLPGVALILAVVIASEIGNIERFATAGRLTAYAGCTPRIHSSGGKTRMGPLRNDVNHYLKWAFAEAGNSVAVNRKRMRHPHVCELYSRIRARRNHAKAVGAVARHLAEATFYMCKREQDYREPQSRAVLSTETQARHVS